MGKFLSHIIVEIFLTMKEYVLFNSICVKLKPRIQNYIYMYMHVYENAYMYMHVYENKLKMVWETYNKVMTVVISEKSGIL